MASVRSRNVRPKSKVAGYSSRKKPMKKSARPLAKKLAKKPLKKKLAKKPIKKATTKRKPIKKTVKKMAVKRKPIKKATTKRKPIRKATTKRKPIKKATPKRKIVKRVAKKKVTPKKKVLKKTGNLVQYKASMKSFMTSLKHMKAFHSKIEKGFKNFGCCIADLSNPISYMKGVNSNFQKQFANAVKGKSTKTIRSRSQRPMKNMGNQLKKWSQKQMMIRKKSKTLASQLKKDLQKAHFYYRQSELYFKKLKKNIQNPSNSKLICKLEGQQRVYKEFNNFYERHINWALKQKNW